MLQSGEQRIEASREAVWRALNDPEVLKQCIEGCEELTKTGENTLEAKIRARVGPVNALFGAEIALEDVVAPVSYTLRGSVKGGAAGFGKGTAKVRLAEAGPQTTVLNYDVEGSVGGKLAQVGQRLIDAAARKMADDFFVKFGALVGTGPAAPAPARASGGAGWIIWAGIAAIALALAAALYAGR